MDLGNPSAASSDDAGELAMLAYLYIDLKQYLTDLNQLNNFLFPLLLVQVKFKSYSKLESNEATKLWIHGELFDMLSILQVVKAMEHVKRTTCWLAPKLSGLLQCKTTAVHSAFAWARNLNRQLGTQSFSVTTHPASASASFSSPFLYFEPANGRSQGRPRASASRRRLRARAWGAAAARLRQDPALVGRATAAATTAQRWERESARDGGRHPR